MWYLLAPLAFICAGGEAILAMAQLRLSAKIARLTATSTRFCAVAVVIFQCVVGARVWSAPMSSMDTIARLIEAQARPGDIVVISPWQWTLSFGTAYHGAAPILRVPPIAEPQFMRWDLARQVAQSSDPLPALFGRIETSLRGGHRVFLVTSNTYFNARHAEILPPHPIDKTNWTIQRYNRSWGNRTARFFGTMPQHSRRISIAKSGFGFEPPELWIYSDWKKTGEIKSP